MNSRITVIDHQLAQATTERTRCREEEPPTPEQLVEQKRIAEHVRGAIRALPTLDRRVVKLLYYRHHGSFEAVARRLGVARRWIFRIHARALAHLRASPAKECLGRNRDSERFREAIATLPDRHRRVVKLLYYRHDGSSEAVPAELCRTRATIVRIHARALEQLRAALAELAA